jgi:cellobiose phosphorylase
VARLQEILPWFAHNAMIHYLAPRGLEQYSGGGWGTRDVTQGPVEMLLSLGQWEPLRDLLMRVYTAQNPDGDWPQWFMFFDRERHIRPSESHGDIVFWPVLALAEYLLASEDAALLDEVVPFFHPQGNDYAEPATLWAHVERALSVMAARAIPGTHLAAYGHGDWNDSLQPADPAMRERLCSTWTVTLHYQTLTILARAMRRLGRAALAAECEASAAQVRADFQRLLIVDETLAGFAYFHPDGRIDYWLHPRDGNTGIHYRLLPMIHAIINDLLTPAQARTHVSSIQQYLLGPDGARLFDRPPPYRGGPQTYFQRAESSTFFGREIGLMYMHAHLRYAQAMARYGDVEAFFLALRQAHPIAIGAVVPAATLRQANCYYSSSDAAFADRYEALAQYDRVKTGAVALEGGWRIYSSGAGIAMRLLHQCFLGLCKEKSVLRIDPMIPASLDGLQVESELAGRKVQISYRIGAAGYGPTAVTLNGTELSFTREANPYRTGGAEVPMTEVLERLTAGTNTLLVCLG